MAEPLFDIRALSVDYVGPAGPMRAVDRASLAVGRGEIVGVAGESGSGKSTLAQAALRILGPPAAISGGEVLFEGEDLLRLDEERLRALRFKRLAVVFQSAMDALNPVLTVGAQIADVLAAHGGGRGAAARERAAKVLAMVGIAPERLRSFPHQLSGGMRQRVCIAMALALEPSLVVLDEPTTALDVVVEREILQQIAELKSRLGFSAMMITHDLARMLQIADRVAVMYAGQIVEVAPARAIEHSPRHPYTQGLLRAFPKVGEGRKREGIPGSPPSLSRPPPGCRFHPRCERAEARCREAAPPKVDLGEGRWAACHRVEQEK